MATNKRELSSTIPSTTTLKLFSYPHKYGGTSWCVGFERSHKHETGEHAGATFVSQTFLTEWSEAYETQRIQYLKWKQILGCKE